MSSNIGTDRHDTDREKPDGREIGDISYIKDAPVEWIDGPTWNFRWLCKDLELLTTHKRGQEIEKYLKAERAGVAQRLSFGTRVKIVDIEKGYSPMFEKYEVEILDGPLKGQTGWTNHQSITGYFRDEP